MQIPVADGVSLEVEDHGPPGNEPLVLIMGLGMQLLGWPAGFVEELVARGFRVLRFDNRDIGLSQSFDHLGMPNVAADALRFTLGLRVRSPYALADMAGDVVGLLDALGLRSAHVCGASMGGMIAQHLAARHPQRVRSLTLLMTSSGARALPGPSLKARSVIMSRPKNPASIDSIVDHSMRVYGVIGSPAYPPAEAELRQRLTQAVQRSYRPQGLARQLVAIAADGSRERLVAQLRQPTQVIHGRADTLVPVAAGHDLAKRIGGARLDIVDGMGHDLPAPLWSRFGAGIAAAAGRA